MVEPSKIKQGLCVLHLFLKPTARADREKYLSAITSFEATENQAVNVALFGHKSDMAVMAIAADSWDLRRLQTAIQGAGFDVADSYMSITEISEYADGLPEGMKQARLYPVLPPEGKNAWCFYPMSKRRNVDQNWFTTSFERRKELMHQHGASGKAFRGRIIQLITGSTGLDDFEWGVSLFGQDLDDLKDAVYTMRFDEASAEFADFGTFYTGNVASASDVLTSIGL